MNDGGGRGISGIPKDVEEILGVDGHDLEGVRLGKVRVGKDILMGSLSDSIDLERLFAVLAPPALWLRIFHTFTQVYQHSFLFHYYILGLGDLLSRRLL